MSDVFAVYHMAKYQHAMYYMWLVILGYELHYTRYLAKGQR